MPDRPIRVLQGIEATTGGTRRHLALLLDRLDPEVFDVSLFYSTERDPAFSEDLERFRARGVTLIEVPMRREIAPFHDAAALFRIWRTMRRGRYDVVHLHSSKAGFLGRWAARFCRAPWVIYSPHGFAFLRGRDAAGLLFLLLEKIASRAHHCLLAVSESEREVALRHHLASRDNVCVIANALPLDEARPRMLKKQARARYGIPPGAPLIGVVAQLRMQKGVRYLIESLPAILKTFPEVRLIVAGDGPQRNKLAARAQRLRVADRVVFTGYLPHPADLYQILDIFLLPSLWEGMPYTILEAMAMGLPVVATDVTGNRDLVLDGKTGYLIPPRDPQAIAERALRLLGNPGLRRSFGARGREEAERRADMGDWIAGYEALYSLMRRK